MKRIFAFLTFLFVASCGISAEDYNFLPFRDALFKNIGSYPVTLVSSGQRLVGSEIIKEKNYKDGEILTAYRGYSVLRDKTYRRDIYAEDFVRANKRGVMNSASVPHIIKNGDTKTVVGEVDIKGTTYRILNSDLDGFVFLLKPDGTVYNKMGQLKDNRLYLLDVDFVVTPEDLRFTEVRTTRSEQTPPSTGFDIKFDGVRLGRMWFTFMDYSLSQGQTNGLFENISFPARPGPVDINGIGIKVLSVDDQKIEYIILKQ